MWVSLLFFSLIIGGSVQADPVASDPSWLRLYHYQKSPLGSYKSDVRSSLFFFSPHGSESPQIELRAAIEAFQNPKAHFGLMQLPAACVFPARLKVLEKLLDLKFPTVNCPDLENWLSRIDAESVSIVYAGAYSGNPASILGHTFLRFDKRHSEKSRLGNDLLSYSVGFLASPNPSDIKPIYAIKGLFGLYPGFYEIEPHYMKVGLYNNAESRDLWQWPLDLSKAEVEFLLLHLWELSFNAEFRYYFLTKNCSYRLLSLLEVVRPNLKLTKNLPLIVVPVETIRELEKQSLLHLPPSFRSSIERRMTKRMENLTNLDLKTLELAKTSVSKVQEIRNPVLLDALIDHWMHKNYSQNAKILPEQAAVLEATYSQRARLPSVDDSDLQSEALRKAHSLFPPLAGHKSSWIETYLLHESQRLGFGLSYTLGAHALWQNSKGYDGVGGIEYLALRIERLDPSRLDWKLKLGQATSIKNFFGFIPRPSWQFDFGFLNSCSLCFTDQPQGYFHASYGLGYQRSYFLMFLMPSLQVQSWFHQQDFGLLAPGFHSGLKVPLANATLLLENQLHWFKGEPIDSLSSRLTWHKQQNLNLYIKSNYDSRRGQRLDSTVQGGAVFYY